MVALLWQMITYAPRLYLADTLLWLLIAGLPAIPGLLIREFFNTLTGASPFNLQPWTWIVLLLTTGLARIAVIFSGRITKTQHRFTMNTLIQRNLLAKLMARPGALPLSTPDGRGVSPGAVLSFSHEDAQQLENNAVATNEVLGEGIFAVGFLGLLVSFSTPTLMQAATLSILPIYIQMAPAKLGSESLSKSASCAIKLRWPLAKPGRL